MRIWEVNQDIPWGFPIKSNGRFFGDAQVAIRHLVGGEDKQGNIVWPRG